MCLLDQICSTGSGPTRQSYKQDEGLYVAGGKVTFNAAGQEIVAEGDLLVTARHAEHSLWIGRTMAATL